MREDTTFRIYAGDKYVDIKTTTKDIPIKKLLEIKNGEELYDLYCAVCHGPEALGDGIIVKTGKGFYPVNLKAPGTVGRTDGFIYAYIRYGGKVMMPSYRESIDDIGAWDLVNYIRKIQNSQ